MTPSRPKLLVSVTYDLGPWMVVSGTPRAGDFLVSQARNGTAYMIVGVREVTRRTRVQAGRRFKLELHRLGRAADTDMPGRRWPLYWYPRKSSR